MNKEETINRTMTAIKLLLQIEAEVDISCDLEAAIRERIEHCYNMAVIDGKIESIRSFNL